MSPRILTAAWVVVLAGLLLLLAWELGVWRGLAAERASAAAERARLTAEIRQRELQLAAELRGQSAALAEMQWSARGSDPGAFLNRVAELVQQKRVKVLAIEPLESQATPQFAKSWHTVRVLAPYREVRDLAARVEAERGIVEDMRIDQPPGPTPAAAPADADEVQARFRLSTLELSPAARQVMERVAAAGGAPLPGAALPGLAVPPPAPAPLARDPFVFPAETARAVARGGASAPAEGAPRRPTPPAAPAVRLSGIVSYPGGYLAVLNDQILKEGDVVDGHRVEKIAETTVVLRDPGGAARTLTLPPIDQR